MGAYDCDCINNLEYDRREWKAQHSREGTISDQPVATDTNVGDKISKFIDGLEEIFADLRERHVDDSVCGLCEYDGAYMGQSGDWCNECPGFDRDDCFKLSDKTRKKWTDEIIKALPSAQPEPQWIPCRNDLPDIGATVLFCDIDGDEFIGHRTSDYWWSVDDKVKSVIAWMPLPTIQPEVKEGHWIRTDCGLDVECKCSVCGYKDFVSPHDTYWFKRNYCPHCGAKMTISK